VGRRASPNREKELTWRWGGEKKAKGGLSRFTKEVTNQKKKKRKKRSEKLRAVLQKTTLLFGKKLKKRKGGKKKKNRKRDFFHRKGEGPPGNEAAVPNGFAWMPGGQVRGRGSGSLKKKSPQSTRYPNSGSLKGSGKEKNRKSFQDS